MKKIMRTLAGIACVISIILAGCEEPDGSMNVLWTLGWIALAFVSGIYLSKTESREERR